MKAKPWQIGLIVVGLVVGLGLIVWYSMGGQEVRLSHRYFLVDVETGEIFDVDSTRYRLMIPAKNPGTGKNTLLGVTKSQEGKWFVPRRELEALKTLDKDVEVKAIDRESGELVVEATNPKTYKP